MHTNTIVYITVHIKVCTDEIIFTYVLTNGGVDKGFHIDSP